MGVVNSLTMQERITAVNQYVILRRPDIIVSQALMFCNIDIVLNVSLLLRESMAPDTGNATVV